jgi:hypothetical protein
LKTIAAFKAGPGISHQPAQPRRTRVMGIRDLERGMSGPDVKAIQEALDLQPGLVRREESGEA